MSELMDAHTNTKHFRRRLLTTVSAAVLIVSVYGVQTANAADNNSDHPIIWIELGGQFDQLSNGQQHFAPSFLSDFAQLPFTSPLPVQNPPKYGYDTEAKISFAPDGSDWTFSASARYGRASGHKESLQEKPIDPVFISFVGFHGFQTARVTYNLHGTGLDSDTHAILDFQTGKDVGLGRFGSGGTSHLSFGVRFAQFTSHAEAGVSGIPTYYIGYHFFQYGKHHHRYQANILRDKEFQGAGPSLSWDGSASLVHADQDSNLSFDWGINGALLFGRQKVRGHHQTTNLYYKSHFIITSGYLTFATGLHSQTQTPKNVNRSRTVFVPNLGGFAGLSFRYSNAKLSLGYRADFFFGAMDGGIDAAKRENVGFYGPFASISVGLGG